MNNTKAHEQLVDDILFAIGSIPAVRVQKRKVGKAVPWGQIKKAMNLRSFNDLRPIDWGIKGEADIQGWIAPFGRGLAVECKTGSGELEEDQEKWRTMFVKVGGLHIVARSVDDALDAVRAEIERQQRLQLILNQIKL